MSFASPWKSESPLYLCCLLALLWFGGLHSALVSAAGMTKQKNEMGSILYGKSQKVHLKIRRLYFCLQDFQLDLKTRCKRNNQRRNCFRTIPLQAWRSCQKHLFQARSLLKTGTTTHQLQVAYLNFDYHQNLAGAPPVPVVKDFFLRREGQKKRLQGYLKRYQRHLSHLEKSLQALKRYHQLQLLLYPRSGLKNTFRLWRIQTRIWLLSLRVMHGSFHLGVVRQSLSSFADRKQQKSLLAEMRKQITQTRQQLLGLQKRLLAAENKLKKKEKNSDAGQSKLQQLERIQRQLRRHLKRLQRRLQQQRSSAATRPALQRLQMEMQREERRSQMLIPVLSASDTPTQLKRWQGCDLRQLRQFHRRQTISGGLLWGGLSSMALGVAGAGAGGFLFAGSFDKNNRPTEASFQRQISLGVLVGSGLLVVTGGVLLAVSMNMQPSKAERIRATLRCPPKQLFPSTNLPMAASLSIPQTGKQRLLLTAR